MITIKEYIFKLIGALQAQKSRIIDENQLKTLGFDAIGGKLAAAFSHYENMATQLPVNSAAVRPLISQLNIIQSEINAITAKLDQIDNDVLAAMDKKDLHKAQTSVTAALQDHGLFSAQQPSESQPPMPNLPNSFAN